MRRFHHFHGLKKNCFARGKRRKLIRNCFLSGGGGFFCTGVENALSKSLTFAHAKDAGQRGRGAGEIRAGVPCGCDDQAVRGGGAGEGGLHGWTHPVRGQPNEHHPGAALDPVVDAAGHQGVVGAGDAEANDLASGAVPVADSPGVLQPATAPAAQAGSRAPSASASALEPVANASASAKPAAPATVAGKGKGKPGAGAAGAGAGAPPAPQPTGGGIIEKLPY
jgi:hypothetical protein